MVIALHEHIINFKYTWISVQQFIYEYIEKVVRNNFVNNYQLPIYNWHFERNGGLLFLFKTLKTHAHYFSARNNFFCVLILQSICLRKWGVAFSLLNITQSVHIVELCPKALYWCVHLWIFVANYVTKVDCPCRLTKPFFAT